MVRRHNRLLVAFHVATDAVLGMVAFILAYVVRFESGLMAATKGQPPLEQYLNVLPFIAVVVPLGFHLQGLYRLRRGRSRIDDFFNVLVGSIFAVGLGLVATLYFQAYWVPQELKDRGAYEVSQPVWARLPRAEHRDGLPVAQVHPRGPGAALDCRRRPAPHPHCGRRRPGPRGGRPHPRAPRAGLPDRGLRRRQGRRRSPRLPGPAAARLADRGRRHRGPREGGPPVRGAAARGAHEAARPGGVAQSREGRGRQGGARPAAVHRAARAARRSRRRAGDQPERRAAAGRQRVHQARARHPGLVGRAAGDARCPGSSSRGSSSAVRRARCSTRRSAWASTARQFTVYKFRTMPLDAENDTGPVWADEDDPRATPHRRAGCARHDLDEWPQFWNVLQGRHVASSGRVPSARSSSSSSSTAFRSTCCGTR